MRGIRANGLLVRTCLEVLRDSGACMHSRAVLDEVVKRIESEGRVFMARSAGLARPRMLNRRASGADRGGTPRTVSRFTAVTDAAR